MPLQLKVFLVCTNYEGSIVFCHCFWDCYGMVGVGWRSCLLSQSQKWNSMDWLLKRWQIL